MNSIPNTYKQTLNFFCSAWTNKLITAKDHASIQINVGHLNEEGVYDGTFTTFALTGRVRSMVGAICLQNSFHQVSPTYLHCCTAFYCSAGRG